MSFRGLGLPRARRHRRARERRILLMGAVGTGDARDEMALAEVLRRLGREIEPLVLTRNPELVSVIHGVASAPDTAKSLVDSVRWCDAIVVVEAPGRADVPVRAEAVTATACAVSRREVARVRIDDGACASSLPSAPSAEAANVVRAAGADPGKPVLLLSPKAMLDEWQTLEQVRVLATAATEWCRRGGSVAGLSLSPRADNGIHRMRRDSVLLAEVGRAASQPVPVIGPLVPPSLLKAVVGLAGAVVAAHPLAIEFAGCANVPCLGFGWEPGVRELLAGRAMTELAERPSADEVVRWIAGLGC